MSLISKDSFSSLPNVLFNLSGSYMDPLSLSALACTNKTINKKIKALALSRMRIFYQENLSKIAAETIGFEAMWNAKAVKSNLVIEYLNDSDTTYCAEDFERTSLTIQQKLSSTEQLINEFENFNSSIVNFYVTTNVENSNPPKKITHTYTAVLFSIISKDDNDRIIRASRNIFICGNQFYRIGHEIYIKNGRPCQFGIRNRNIDVTLVRICNFLFDHIAANESHIKDLKALFRGEAVIFNNNVYCAKAIYQLYHGNSANQIHEIPMRANSIMHLINGVFRSIHHYFTINLLASR